MGAEVQFATSGKAYTSATKCGSTLACQWLRGLHIITVLRDLEEGGDSVNWEYLSFDLKSKNLESKLWVGGSMRKKHIIAIDEKNDSQLHTPATKQAKYKPRLPLIDGHNADTKSKEHHLCPSSLQVAGLKMAC